MVALGNESLDVKIRDALSLWNKIDETDLKILEGLSMLGPRNFKLIAKRIGVPSSTVQYRIRRMLNNSTLFLHVNPYHTNMGLKKAVIFLEAYPGLEDLLLDCLRLHDYWLYLCRIYGPFEGCGGIWTVPKGREGDFIDYMKGLIDAGVARSIEVNWTTCHEGIPVKSRWFDYDMKSWIFDWTEWLAEVETIEGDLPWTIVEPDDWPIRADKVDLLIIKELEIDARQPLTTISKKLGINVENLKYHYRNHVLKNDLIEGYQVEIFRFPSLISEMVWFKFHFNSYEKLVKFALSLHDKPFPIHLGKVLGELALTSFMYLPKMEFRRFIACLADLINRDLLVRYHYYFQDMFQSWRETIPYQHFDGKAWIYDKERYQEELKKVLSKWGK
jgi:DNA-binding Lrp family transcriptional regulator